MTQRSRALSPQLKALGPDIRLLAVFMDAIAAYGHYCVAVQARVDTAMLTEREDGDGWNLTKAQRVLDEQGWRDAEGIYDAAGIPDKHRRVVDLAVWGDPGKHKGRMFTSREIADLTGHPERTVKLWLSLDMPRLRSLGVLVAAA